MDTSILDCVVAQLKDMPENLQQQVLEYARALASSKIQGVPGQQLLRFAGVIPTDDIQLMRAAIEQDCEQVDTSEW
jgi:predicted transcriptional regulator